MNLFLGRTGDTVQKIVIGYSEEVTKKRIVRNYLQDTIQIDNSNLNLIF